MDKLLQYAMHGHGDARPTVTFQTREHRFTATGTKVEATQRWSAMSRVTLNFDLSKIPSMLF